MAWSELKVCFFVHDFHHPLVNLVHDRIKSLEWKLYAHPESAS